MRKLQYILLLLANIIMSEPTPLYAQETLLVPITETRASLLLVYEAMLVERQEQALKDAIKIIDTDEWTWLVFEVQSAAHSIEVKEYYYGAQ